MVRLVATVQQLVLPEARRIPARLSAIMSAGQLAAVVRHLVRPDIHCITPADVMIQRQMNVEILAISQRPVVPTLVLPEAKITPVLMSAQPNVAAAVIVVQVLVRPEALRIPVRLSVIMNAARPVATVQIAVQPVQLPQVAVPVTPLTEWALPNAVIPVTHVLKTTLVLTAQTPHVLMVVKPIGRIVQANVKPVTRITAEPEQRYLFLLMPAVQVISQTVRQNVRRGLVIPVIQNWEALAPNP